MLSLFQAMVKTSSSNIKIIRLPKIIKIFERRISDTKIEATIWQFLAGSQRTGMVDSTGGSQRNAE